MDATGVEESLLNVTDEEERRKGGELREGERSGGEGRRGEEKMEEGAKDGVRRGCDYWPADVREGSKEGGGRRRKEEEEGTDPENEL